VKYGDQSSVVLSNLNECASFSEGNSEWLVYYDVFACVEGGGGQRVVAFVGSSDNYEIYVGVRCRFGSGTDGYVGEIVMHSIWFA
jgi:hypothetical protein